MTTAGRLPRHDGLLPHRIAERAGHTPQFAFTEAFEREYGVAPGRYRGGLP